MFFFLCGFKCVFLSSLLHTHLHLKSSVKRMFLMHNARRLLTIVTDNLNLELFFKGKGTFRFGTIFVMLLKT